MIMELVGALIRQTPRTCGAEAFICQTFFAVNVKIAPLSIVECCA